MQESTRQKLFQLFTDRINYLNQRLTNINIDIKNLTSQRSAIRDQSDKIRAELKNYNSMYNHVITEVPESNEKEEMLKDIDIHRLPLISNMNKWEEEDTSLTVKIQGSNQLNSYYQSDIVQLSNMIDQLNKLDS